MPDEVELLPAPRLDHHAHKSKWEREQAAFLRLLPGLLQTNAGEFVAVHDGRVVAHGPDEVAVIQSAHQKVGYVALHVSRVTTEPEEPFRVASPRNWRAEVPE